MARAAGDLVQRTLLELSLLPDPCPINLGHEVVWGCRVDGCRPPAGPHVEQHEHRLVCRREHRGGHRRHAVDIPGDGGVSPECGVSVPARQIPAHVLPAAADLVRNTETTTCVFVEGVAQPVRLGAVRLLNIKFGNEEGRGVAARRVRVRQQPEGGPRSVPRRPTHMRLEIPLDPGAVPVSCRGDVPVPVRPPRCQYQIPVRDRHGSRGGSGVVPDLVRPA